MDARSVTALVLATMSLSLVFAAGRMSAWIVPVSDTPLAVADRQDRQKPVKEPSSAKTALAAKPRAAPSPGVIEAAIGEAKTPPEATSQSLANPAEASGAVAPKVAEEVLRGMEVTTRQAPPDPDIVSTAPAAPNAPVVLNVGSAANGSRAADSVRPAATGGQEPDKPDEGAVGQCERRYSSFRQSDRTYQPFDGGPRKRCPLLQ